MIIQEWHYITKVIEAGILVIDMPLLDTRNDATNLIGKFISDIVLQILSLVAEIEKENIRARQAGGIRLAKERGVHMGRPKMILPNNFKEISYLYQNKKVTCTKAANLTNMSWDSFISGIFDKIVKFTIIFYFFYLVKSSILFH